MPETRFGHTAEDIARARQQAEVLRALEYPVSGEVPKDCDLVMKGGITSGVVYPLAACELARTYRFRSIGGSSAGAIAACLVAAAEYGRDTGGFNRLAALPDRVGPILPQLFKPGPSTRTAHAALMGWLDPNAPRNAKVRRVLRTLVRSQRRVFWRSAGGAVAVAAVLAVLLAGVPDDSVAIARFVGALLAFTAIGLVTAVVVAIVAEAKASRAGLADQGFGICVGSAGEGTAAPSDADPGYLTDWLAARIDDVAGIDRPLLVGDLTEAGIDLQVMTTNLTHGRPMSFPFTGRVFLFDPVELARYFPGAVVEALLVDEEPATEDGRPLLSGEGRPLYRLPPAARLPVVLAARMSLSFPGLISAVPLYAVDFARKAPEDRVAVRCWFSDGGITSNFPIHFFDALWPRRPTFALDLRGYHTDFPETDVYYAGAEPRQPRVRPIESLEGFAASILDTMQYWADDAQSTLPGYRDRVVEVHLRSDEGGFNLQMPADVVTVVAEKGRLAAERLAAGFDLDQHRWTRYLTSMGRLQEGIDRMDLLYGPSAPGAGDGMRDLLARGPDFEHYRRSSEWGVKARNRTETLLQFVAADDPDFVADAPAPEPVLRITPRF